MSTLPDNKEGYTMADQTSNEISHIQSVNRGREAQRSKIKLTYQLKLRQHFKRIQKS